MPLDDGEVIEFREMIARLEALIPERVQPQPQLQYFTLNPTPGPWVFDRPRMLNNMVYTMDLTTLDPGEGGWPWIKKSGLPVLDDEPKEFTLEWTLYAYEILNWTI